MENIQGEIGERGSPEKFDMESTVSSRSGHKNTGDVESLPSETNVPISSLHR